MTLKPAKMSTHYFLNVQPGVYFHPAFQSYSLVHSTVFLPNTYYVLAFCWERGTQR